MHAVARNFACVSLAAFVIGCKDGAGNQNRTLEVDALTKDPEYHSKQWYCKDITLTSMLAGPEHLVPFEGYLRYVDKGTVPKISYADPYCHLYRLHTSKDPNSKSLPVIVVLFEPGNGKVVPQQLLAPESKEPKHVSFKADLFVLPDWFSPSKMNIESEKNATDKFVLWIDPRSKESRFKNLDNN